MSRCWRDAAATRACRNRSHDGGQQRCSRKNSKNDLHAGPRAFVIFENTFNVIGKAFRGQGILIPRNPPNNTPNKGCEA